MGGGRRRARRRRGCRFRDPRGHRPDPPPRRRGLLRAVSRRHESHHRRPRHAPRPLHVGRRRADAGLRQRARHRPRFGERRPPRHCHRRYLHGGGPPRRRRDRVPPRGDRRRGGGGVRPPADRRLRGGRLGRGRRRGRGDIRYLRPGRQRAEPGRRLRRRAGRAHAASHARRRDDELRGPAGHVPAPVHPRGPVAGRGEGAARTGRGGGNRDRQRRTGGTRGVRDALADERCLAILGGGRSGAWPRAPRLRVSGIRPTGRRDAPRRVAMDNLTERRRPAWGRILRRVLAGAVLGVVVVLGLALAFSADARYVARAGLAEARILWRRRAIAKLLADSAVSDALKQRLRLVLAARAFAADSLRLAAGQTYTTYVSVGRDTLLLVLSASRKDKLRQYTWRFPVVGVVPYKGFFDFARARREAGALGD